MLFEKNMLLINAYIFITITTSLYIFIKLKNQVNLKVLKSKKTKKKSTPRANSKQKSHLYQKYHKIKIKKNTSYQAIGALFTKCEHNFYNSLVQVIPDKYVIFGKVRIADILEPATKNPGKARMKLFYQICAKHIDYVICNKSTLNVICCIELHDSSHDNAERQARDKFVREIFKGAKIKLIEIKATKNYSAKQLQQDLKCII